VDVSDSLRRMGIELLRAAPSQVICDVLPFVSSPAWSFFIASLSAILYSVSTEQSTSLNLSGYRIDSKNSSLLPFPLPRVSIEVTNKGSKQLEWLFDNAFEEQEIRGKVYFVCEEPTTEDLRSLLDGTSTVEFNERNFVPIKTANISAILVLTEMINTLSYLAQVLQFRLYDRLPKRSDIIEDKGDIGNIIASMEIDSDARDTTKEKFSGNGLFEIKRLYKSILAIFDGPSGSDVVDGESLSANPTCTSPESLTLPKLSAGTFLKYVPELSSEDSRGVVDFFAKYLKRSLGHTTTEIVERLDDYRSAWGLLKSTETGQCLSHLVKCFEIAIDAHCGILPVFDGGVYTGCVLQGTGYTLNFRHEKTFPLDAQELSTDIASMETNGRILEKIKQLLRARSADSNIRSADLTRPGKLRQLLLKGSFNDEQRNEMKELVGKVRFPQKRWPVTLTSITKFLNILSSPLDEISLDDPIGPEAMFSTDPLEIAMSCFKPNCCPSFRCPSGVKIDLSLTKPPAPPNSRTEKKGKGPQQINNGGWIFSVRRVDFFEAVSDFRILIKEREARSLGSSASRGLGYFVLSGGNFERVFLDMRRVIGVFDPSSFTETQATDEGLGTKRSAVDNLDDGVVTRKRKVML
jgi:hypothetical protein